MPQKARLLPAVIERCAAHVAERQVPRLGPRAGLSSAIAICTASAQRRGLVEPGSRRLTSAGRRAERSASRRLGIVEDRRALARFSAAARKKNDAPRSLTAKRSGWPYGPARPEALFRGHLVSFDPARGVEAYGVKFMDGGTEVRGHFSHEHGLEFVPTAVYWRGRPAEFDHALADGAGEVLVPFYYATHGTDLCAAPGARAARNLRPGEASPRIGLLGLSGGVASDARDLRLGRPFPDDVSSVRVMAGRDTGGRDLAPPRAKRNGAMAPWMDRDGPYYHLAESSVYSDDSSAFAALNKLDRMWRPDPTKLDRAKARVARLDASRPARIEAYARERYANDVANGFQGASQAVLDAFPAPRIPKRNGAAYRVVRDGESASRPYAVVGPTGETVHRAATEDEALDMARSENAIVDRKRRGGDAWRFAPRYNGAAAARRKPNRVGAAPGTADLGALFGLVRELSSACTLRGRYAPLVGGNPATRGQCENAAALFHLLAGGTALGWRMMRIGGDVWPLGPHYFVRHVSGVDIDPTADQFPPGERVPYEKARGQSAGGFRRVPVGTFVGGYDLGGQTATGEALRAAMRADPEAVAAAMRAARAWAARRGRAATASGTARRRSA